MDTLQDMVAEKERQREGPGNLFTPYGYRPPALGGEPTPSPTGMSKQSGNQAEEVSDSILLKKAFQYNFIAGIKRQLLTRRNEC